MSVGTVRSGLFGKLPAHGDFVARGDPAIVAWIERWLTIELGALAGTQGDELDRLLAQAPVWRFALRHDGITIAGAMLPSIDRVGRLFPLVVFAESEPGTVQAHADALAVMPLDRSTTADDAMIAIAAVSTGEGDGLFGGDCWRSDDQELAIDGLPAGADFMRLLGAADPAP